MIVQPPPLPTLLIERPILPTPLNNWSLRGPTSIITLSPLTDMRILKELPVAFTHDRLREVSLPPPDKLFWMAQAVQLHHLSIQASLV
jgi:hypothetical protein